MKLTFISTAFAVATSFVMAAEHRVASPDGKLALIVSDAGSLSYHMDVDGQPLLQPSRLGLEFAGGIKLGPATTIRTARAAKHDGTWENRFGPRRCARPLEPDPG